MSTQQDLIQQLQDLSLEEEHHIERLIEVTERRNRIIAQLSQREHTSHPVSTIASVSVAEAEAEEEESVAKAASTVSGVTIPTLLSITPNLTVDEQSGRVRGRQTVVVIHNKTYKGRIGESTSNFIRGQHVVILSTTKGYKGFKARVTHTEGKWVWIRFLHPRTQETIECYRAPKSLLITRNP